MYNKYLLVKRNISRFISCYYDKTLVYDYFIERSAESIEPFRC